MKWVGVATVAWLVVGAVVTLPTAPAAIAPALALCIRPAAPAWASSVVLGDTLRLAPQLIINGATSGSVPATWASGDTTVATVRGGLVVAVRVGSTFVQATTAGVLARYCVTVVRGLVPVATIGACAVGYGFRLGGPPRPLSYVDAAGRELHNVRWTSSDSTVVSISPVGLATPLAVGQVMIGAVGTDSAGVAQPPATFPMIVRVTWANVTGNPFAWAGIDGSVSAPTDVCNRVRIVPN